MRIRAGGQVDALEALIRDTAVPLLTAEDCGERLERCRIMCTDLAELMLSPPSNPKSVLSRQFICPQFRIRSRHTKAALIESRLLTQT